MSEIIIESLGIDPGNGYIKLKSNSIEVLEPLIISNVSSTYQFNKFDFLVRKDDKRYIIGNEALKSGFKFRSVVGENDIDRYNEFFYWLLSSYIYKNFGFSNKKLIIKSAVIGVPNNIYSILKNKVEKELSNMTQCIKVEDDIKEVVFEKIKVVPQPFGTYYSNKEYASKNVYIIDYGFGSVDYTYFKNNNVVENFGTNNGIRKTLVQIQKHLEEKYNGLVLSPFEVIEVLKTSKLRYGGDIKNIDRKNISNFLQSAFDNILEEVITRHNNLAAIDLVVFTGGATMEIKSDIEALNLKNVIVTSDPQLSNAIGYYNIACNM
ncbi:MAG: hypothetical protein ACK5NF_04035 [Bacilli bacterium]